MADRIERGDRGNRAERGDRGNRADRADSVDRVDRHAPRLDQPQELRRSRLPRPTYNAEGFGRASERFARFMGTAAFLVYMSAFVLLWLLYNWTAGKTHAFDPYPFIFLTLMLSLQASYAAPLILLAQNRQAERDRVALEQDRARDERNLADTEYLTREVAALRIALREVATRDFLRSELRSLLDELEERGSDRSSGKGLDGGGRGVGGARAAGSTGSQPLAEDRSPPT